MEELEIACPDCGNGKKRSRSSCGRCHGTGYELTDKGEDLFEFWERCMDRYKAIYPDED